MVLLGLDADTFTFIACLVGNVTGFFLTQKMIGGRGIENYGGLLRVCLLQMAI
ncbi:MAG: hypothetical protein ACP5ER_02690 [Candidatus Bathyarchaeales archaeon]